MAGLLRCEECGCASDEHATGWAAFIGEDPDDLEPPCVGVFCPACSAEEFGYRPDVGDAYT